MYPIRLCLFTIRRISGFEKITYDYVQYKQKKATILDYFGRGLTSIVIQVDVAARKVNKKLWKIEIASASISRLCKEIIICKGSYFQK